MNQRDVSDSHLTEGHIEKQLDYHNKVEHQIQEFVNELAFIKIIKDNIFRFFEFLVRITNMKERLKRTIMQK